MGHREFEGFGSGGGQRHQSLCECAVGIRWSSFVAFAERHEGRVPLFVDVRPWAGHRRMTVGINESRFATRAWACGERVRYPTIFPKSLIRYLMTGDGIVANRGLVEMLGSLVALADYRPSLRTLTFEGGDLHWRLLH